MRQVLFPRIAEFRHQKPPSFDHTPDGGGTVSGDSLPSASASPAATTTAGLLSPPFSWRLPTRSQCVSAS
jgi:hypothetical protein